MSKRRFRVDFEDRGYVVLELENKVIDVSGEIDDLVARRKLAAWDIEIDQLTDEQKAYLGSWNV